MEEGSGASKTGFAWFRGLSMAERERPAERYFRESKYWEVWSKVPDVTADLTYALAAVRSTHRLVLDVPCGRGRLLKAVLARYPSMSLYGVDVNSDMVRQTRDAIRAVRVAVASVYAMPFRDRTFDLVVCHQSFMHFEDPLAALKELTRVARTDVYMSITTRRQLNTALRHIGLLATSDVPHWTYNIEEVKSMLARTDFDWTVTGAFLIGKKVLRVSEETYLNVHRAIGQRLPQRVLRRFGQTLFLYGRRREDVR
jgi:SAM-dependent methyltransferase